MQVTTDSRLQRPNEFHVGVVAGQFTYALNGPGVDGNAI